MDRFGGMRPFGDVLPLDEAQRIIDAAARAVEGAVRVPLGDAAGRVLADDLPAPFDVPGFARSAMDGYAVRAADLASATADAPVWLPVAATARPGELTTVTSARPACVAIATGSPIPDGFDAVVMVEHTVREDERVRFVQPASTGQHVTPRGHDVAEGAVVLRGGDLLTPARLGVVASFGFSTLLVRRAPIVALISSGDELLELAAEGTARPGPGQIYDANRTMLGALCREHGADVRLLPIVRDTLDEWSVAFDAAADADLIVCSGGTSVGEHDYGRDILSARGELLFHGIAVKPGKPTAFARIGSQLVLAMPGNPTSCLSNAYVLLRPLVRRLAGLPPLQPRTWEATLTRDLSSPPDRVQFHPVRLDGDQATPMFKGSGDVTSLAGADGYVEVPREVTRVVAGTRVVVRLY